MVHTALNSLKMILQNQQITSQNISNASVVGYRRDSNSEFGTAYLNSEIGLNTRVFANAPHQTRSESVAMIKPKKVLRRGTIINHKKLFLRVVRICSS